MRSKTPIYSLPRQLLRPSWNKYNLFNLTRKQMPSIHNKTMYQQKWEAKKETRAYHGDHLSERQFKKIWRPRIFGVVPESARDTRRVPLASQTFACVERRLDTVLFRAMFASSIRQARQLVIHGKVKLNGAQQRNPGSLLKAGDLFQVMPSAVIMNTCSTPVQITQEAEISSEAEGASDDEATDPKSLARSRPLKISHWESLGHNDFIPKSFMSALAFIPSYLEVDFEICSGVYLRHPVARPGLSEVPSPFPSSVQALAANFYQRGR